MTKKRTSSSLGPGILVYNIFPPAWLTQFIWENFSPVKLVVTTVACKLNFPCQKLN